MQLFYKGHQFQLKQVADVIVVYKNTTFGWEKVDTCQSKYVAQQRITSGKYNKY